MTDRKLMQQALEALQAYGAHTSNCDHLMLLLSLPPQRKPCSCGLVAIMQALRERLAQPEQHWIDEMAKVPDQVWAQPEQEPVKESSTTHSHLWIGDLYGKEKNT